MRVRNIKNQKCPSLEKIVTLEESDPNFVTPKKEFKPTLKDFEMGEIVGTGTFGCV